MIVVGVARLHDQRLIVPAAEGRWPITLGSRAHIALYQTDILFNPLPTFHCFGLTVGSLMPLLLGIKVVCHPTPLQPK